jgi:hypothetical protein
VVSSVAAPISGAAFGAGAADDVPTCCEVDSFEIRNVDSPAGPPTGDVVLGLAAIVSGYEEDGLPGSPRLNDNAGPAAKGLGLGIGIAYSACEEDVSVSSELDDNAEPADAGLGLGIGIAKADAERAVLPGASTCCVGCSSGRMYQHLC